MYLFPFFFGQFLSRSVFLPDCEVNIGISIFVVFHYLSLKGSHHVENGWRRGERKENSIYVHKR